MTNVKKKLLKVSPEDYTYTCGVVVKAGNVLGFKYDNLWFIYPLSDLTSVRSRRYHKALLMGEGVINIPNRLGVGCSVFNEYKARLLREGLVVNL